MPEKKEIICVCFQRTKSEIEKAIRKKNLVRVAQVGEALQAGTNCGRCQSRIQHIIDDIYTINEGLFANTDNK
jgi:NAD(P)H-nitrite reductase large subunit